MVLEGNRNPVARRESWVVAADAEGDVRRKPEERSTGRRQSGVKSGRGPPPKRPSQGTGKRTSKVRLRAK